MTKTTSTNDNVTHINISFSGATILGRMLSDYYKMAFSVPGFGQFMSLEAYKYYIKADVKTEKDFQARENLRATYEIKAKRLGSKLKVKKINGYYKLLEWGAWNKVISNPDLVELMKNSTLPFAIYWIDQTSGLQISPIGYNKVCEIFENIRSCLKTNTVISQPDIRSCLG